MGADYIDDKEFEMLMILTDIEIARSQNKLAKLDAAQVRLDAFKAENHMVPGLFID